MAPACGHCVDGVAATTFRSRATQMEQLHAIEQRVEARRWRRDQGRTLKKETPQKRTSTRRRAPPHARVGAAERHGEEPPVRRPQEGRVAGPRPRDRVAQRVERLRRRDARVLVELLVVGRVLGVQRLGDRGDGNLVDGERVGGGERVGVRGLVVGKVDAPFRRRFVGRRRPRRRLGRGRALLNWRGWRRLRRRREARQRRQRRTHRRIGRQRRLSVSMFRHRRRAHDRVHEERRQGRQAQIFRKRVAPQRRGDGLGARAVAERAARLQGRELL